MACTVGVLVVSDRAAADGSVDRSGPRLAELIAQGAFTVVKKAIVADEIAQIQEKVITWVNAGLDIIVTSGGTGFGTRDLTPEAVTPLLHRHAPGLVFRCLQASMEKTPMAALSRPVAGIRDGTVIVTFPGSVKAVEECWDALKGVLRHASELAKGGTGRITHEKMAQEGTGQMEQKPVTSGSLTTSEGHRHHHHHHHPHHSAAEKLSMDPSRKVSDRQRQSPYPIIAMEEALKHITNAVERLDQKQGSVAELRGNHILGEIVAPCDLPRTATSNVDGYAVRSCETPGEYRVETSKTRSHGTGISSTLPGGPIYRIATGGAVPDGYDAVAMVEESIVSEKFEDGEEKSVRILNKITAGDNIRAAGSDAKKGDVVLPAFSPVTASGGEIATLAFLGIQEVTYTRSPVIAVMSTGNEIMDLSLVRNYGRHAGDLPFAQVPDTNRPALLAAARGLGLKTIDLGIIKDDMVATVQALRDGMTDIDIIITTGGTSMGEADLLKPAIEHHLNGTIHFGRVAMKPGKPTTFATIPRKTSRPIVFFALPGNPASALVTFWVFVVPAIRKMMGYRPRHDRPLDPWGLPMIQAECDCDLQLDPRPEYHRVIVTAGGAKLVARTTGGQRSSRASSMAGFNGLVALPALKQDESSTIPKGTLVKVLMVGPIV